MPDYEVFGAATPHPLHVALAAAGGLLGDDGAISFLRGVAFLAYGGLIWGAFRLGQAAFSTPVGLVAAVLIVSNHRSLGNGTVDSLFVPLVLLAGWLEATVPRRGAPVLVLLALAGLLRPDAWVLSAAYWLYIAPGLDRGSRVRTALLAAAGPLVWALSDLAITGDPLYSLLYTQEAADQLGRVTGLVNVPAELVDGLRTQLRPVEYLGGGIGLAACLYLRRGGALVPMALVASGVLVFLALGVADLPLNDRYLRLTATGLTVLAAFAAAGWLAEQKVSARHGLQVAGALVAVGFIALIPSEIEDFRGEASDRALEVQGREDLRTLMRRAEDQGLLDRCAPLQVADRKLVALEAYYADERVGDVIATEERPPERGLVVVPVDPRTTRDLVSAQQFERARGWSAGSARTVLATPSWRLIARGCPS